MAKRDNVLSDAKARGVAPVGLRRGVFATVDANRFARWCLLEKQLAEINDFVIR